MRIFSLLTVALLMAAVPGQAAQPKTSMPVPAQETATAPTAFPLNAEQIRRELSAIMRDYPPSLAEVLRLDPSLLGDHEYLKPYTRLNAFLTEHPEIAHNPSFFVGSEAYREPRDQTYRVWQEAAEGIFFFALLSAAIGFLVWIIRTGLDYRRWQRLSKIQVDVHSKLMDRLTSNEDLLGYIQTPAGQRFLENVPVSIDGGPRITSAPVGRILWSAQAGLVLGFGGMGLYYAFLRLGPDEGREPFLVISILAMALGAGFIASAGFAYVLSKRLGLLDQIRAGMTKDAHT